MRGKAAQSLSMEDVTRSNVSGLGLRRRSSFPSLGLPRASGPLPAKLCASLPFSRVPTLVGSWDWKRRQPKLRKLASGNLLFMPPR